ncbi:MAG: cytochrome c peroxidase [Bacteroidota bacterium]
MKQKFFIGFFLCVTLCAFHVIDTKLFVSPENWPKPSYDFTQNPLTFESVQLGRHLFYDPILSKNNKISCASCHSQYTAFTHVDHNLSHGIDDRIGVRNSPALMNLAWHTSFMWDGAVNHLDVQALAPISHPDEMGESIQQVVTKLGQSEKYKKLFYKAYGDRVITGERTLKTISQFMLTLVSANSKYDSVMRKQKQFTTQEKRGYALFQKNCNTCHTEPLFTNLQFENNGLSVDTTLNDFGRMKITKNNSDSLKFKVPTLRNVEFSYPYMHDGRFKTLSQVLKHYTNGVHQSETLAKSLDAPIVLSSNDKVDLVAFLLTLTDKKFLFDPRYSFPK